MPDTAIATPAAAKPEAAPIRPVRPVSNLPASLQTDMLANPELFAHMQRVAQVFVSSALIPDHLKKNNGADALLALQIARERGESPVTVMQSIYFVSGKAGWAATYMIARANKSGAFKGRINWRIEGKGTDALKVTAFATLADTGEVVDAETSLAMARDEGWTKNPKYKTMPDHMLKYRSATMLIRLYCPEVLIGMQTVDELQDLRAAGQLRDVTDEGHATTADQVADILSAGATQETTDSSGDTDEVAHDAETGEIIDATATDERKAEPEAENLLVEGAGQEELAGKIVDMIKKATTAERVNAIVATNAERMKKWTSGNRAKVTIAADDKLEDLQRL